MRLQADGLPTLHFLRVTDDGGPRMVLLADSLDDLLAWHERLTAPELAVWSGLASGDGAYAEVRGEVGVGERVPVEVLCLVGREFHGRTVPTPWIRNPVTVEQLRECAGVARGSG